MKLSILIFSSIALCVTGVASIPAKRELNVGPLGLRKFLEAVPTGTTSVPVSSATPSQGATSEKPSDVQVAELAPPLGFQSGLNPDGTGFCDGAVNGEILLSVDESKELIECGQAPMATLSRSLVPALRHRMSTSRFVAIKSTSRPTPDIVLE